MGEWTAPANCGDWVDSWSAIVEHSDGRLELIVSDGHHSPSKQEESRASAVAADVATGETTQ